jgi:hypothetical protein
MGGCGPGVRLSTATSGVERARRPPSRPWFNRFLEWAGRIVSRSNEPKRANEQRAGLASKRQKNPAPDPALRRTA